jgi:hypothetical protein
MSVSTFIPVRFEMSRFQMQDLSQRFSICQKLCLSIHSVSINLVNGAKIQIIILIKKELNPQKFFYSGKFIPLYFQNIQSQYLYQLNNTKIYTS